MVGPGNEVVVFGPGNEVVVFGPGNKVVVSGRNKRKLVNHLGLTEWGWTSRYECFHPSIGWVQKHELRGGYKSGRHEYL